MKNRDYYEYSVQEQAIASEGICPGCGAEIEYLGTELHSPLVPWKNRKPSWRCPGCDKNFTLINTEVEDDN